VSFIVRTKLISHHAASLGLSLSLSLSLPLSISLSMRQSVVYTVHSVRTMHNKHCLFAPPTNSIPRGSALLLYLLLRLFSRLHSTYTCGIRGHVKKYYLSKQCESGSRGHEKISIRIDNDIYMTNEYRGSGRLISKARNPMRRAIRRLTRFNLMIRSPTIVLFSTPQTSNFS